MPAAITPLLPLFTLILTFHFIDIDDAIIMILTLIIIDYAHAISHITRHYH
jgi:hypothetical protein